MPRLTTLSRSVSGQIAIVTGAASGMGRATAHLLADEGARVAVADRNGPGAEAVAAEIRDAGGDARAWEVDVAQPDAVTAFVADVVVVFGGINILVNNAGVSVPAPIDAPNWEEAWALTLAVNLTGEARLARACLPHLLASGAGRIVNIASTEGLGASAYMTPYTASKHGVVGLTRSLAVELGSRGVTVNCICPGTHPYRDDRADPRRVEGDLRQAAGAAAPLRRPGGEVAHITLSLVAPGRVVHQRRHHFPSTAGSWPRTTSGRCVDRGRVRRRRRSEGGRRSRPSGRAAGDDRDTEAGDGPAPGSSYAPGLPVVSVGGLAHDRQAQSGSG